MKNDSTVTFLNIALAALVILGVLFALLNIWRTRDLRHMQTSLQVQMQRSQVTAARAQQLLQDTIAYNTKVNSPELAEIIKAAETPPQPAAK